MSLNLYNEAIVEAKQLRELAEQNAKNKIIKAITPKIKKLIEQQLVADEEEDELVIGDEELESLSDVVSDDVEDEEIIDLGALADLPPPSEEIDGGFVAPPPPEKSKVSITVQGDLNMDLEEDDDSIDDLLLSQEGIASLDNFLREYSRNQTLQERLNKLDKKVKRLSETIKGVDLRTLSPVYRQITNVYYANLLKEAYNLTDSIILINESIDQRLERQLLLTLKEIKDMSRRRDAVVFRRLFEELAEDEQLREMGLTEQEEEEIDVDVEAEEEVVEELPPVEVTPDQAADAVETLLADLGLGDDVSVSADEEVEEVGVEAEEEEVDLEVEGWMGEGDDVDETDEELDEVYEIDENVIRRELRRLRRLREQEEGRAAEADPFLAHGGDDEGDVVVDVDEDDLLNALADELGDPGVSAPDAGGRPAGGNLTPEAFRRRIRNRRLQESRRRKGRRTTGAKVVVKRALVAERANVKLKKQLKEMNLFNAKLLFANKLMQNRDLSTKQQRAIVEALDRAKTIHEAKLLYKTLSESLSRRKSGRTLSESRSRLLSSSSKSTRSGSPATNGASTDRWATLAGINPDD